MKIVIRLIIYLVGIVSVSLGIVLCSKCGLGISPVSSWPYFLSFVFPLSFGTLTMLYHMANIVVQLILKKHIEAKILLQLPVAVLFGIIIDIIQNVLRVDNSFIAVQVVLLVLSILFTAFGMVCMINMDIVQNPPDGTVKLLSEKLNREMGKVKISYDILMVITSCIVSFLFFRKLIGLGVATVLSAIFVGKCMTLFQKLMGNSIKKVAGLDLDG